MKKNGFIATSLMFSFFIIFLTMTLMIMATYTQYQTLINSSNENVLNDLNDNVIIGKFTTLYNSIIDGDFDSIKTGAFNSTAWTLGTNAVAYNDESTQRSSYIRLKPTAASFGQTINSSRLLKKRATSSKIYVRYNVFRNYTINCTNDQPYLKIGSITYTLKAENRLCGEYSSWNLYSEILTVNVNSDSQYLGFNVSNMKTGVDNDTNFSELNINIDNVMVIDVTDVYKNGTTDAQVKAFLDSELSSSHDQFLLLDGGYPIKKR
ncbi:MAG: hypothetical protein E7159_03735 [Firmicutes bacterium]|nr:hypothetical protein [Bacillota bacterium]